MKNNRTSTLWILFGLLFVLAFTAGVARADDADELRDTRIISARAGRVNFVVGDVRVRRAGSPEQAALTSTDELKSGDTVTVGAGGRVEILLNPGSYFRAGAGTEFTLAEAELDDLRVELARGGAVVEAMGYGENDLAITVATPGSTVRIIRTGVYRINALAGGAVEVAVEQGRALLGTTLVRGGKVARAGAGGVELSKFDKKNRDELDLWSRARGKELAKANERLQRRTLNTAFAGIDFGRFPGGYGNGFWFYNDRTQCYTFLPFGWGWRSPYGHWYETGVIVYGQRPGGAYVPMPGPGGTYGGPGSNNGGGSNPIPPGGNSGGGSGGGFNGGGAPPPRPSGGDVIERTPSVSRPERNPSEGMPRRDQ